MSYGIYFLQTQKDFYRLCEFVYEIQCRIYSYEGKLLSLEELKDWNKPEIFRILTSEEDVNLVKIGNRMMFSDESLFLEFSNCRPNLRGEITEGSIIYDQGEQLLRAFKAIKKFIKTNYMRLDSPSIKVAEDFYQQWLARKVSAIWLLRREEIQVCFPEGERRKFLEELQKEGLVVTTFSDYRKEPDLNADTIVISLPEDHIKIQIRGRHNYVQHDEKCIYLYRYKKYDSLCLDKRLITEGAEIVKVFERLRSRLENFVYVPTSKNRRAGN